MNSTQENCKTWLMIINTWIDDPSTNSKDERTNTYVRQRNLHHNASHGFDHP